MYVNMTISYTAMNAQTDWIWMVVEMMIQINIKPNVADASANTNLYIFKKKTDIFKEMWRSLCLHRDILSLCVYDYVLFVWMRRQIEVAWKFREIRQKKRDKEELNEEKSKLRRWNTKTGSAEGGVVEFKMRYIYIFPI